MLIHSRKGNTSSQFVAGSPCSLVGSQTGWLTPCGRQPVPNGLLFPVTLAPSRAATNQCRAGLWGCVCSHPHTSIICVPLITDESFIYSTTFLSSFTEALRGVVHHHHKTHYNKILPLESLKMKARQRELRQSGKSKAGVENGHFTYLRCQKGHIAGEPGQPHKGLESLAEMGLDRSRQSLDKNGEDGMDWFTGLMHPKSGKSLEQCLVLGVRLYLSPASFPPLSSKFFLVGGAVVNLRKELESFSRPRANHGISDSRCGL